MGVSSIEIRSVSRSELLDVSSAPKPRSTTPEPTWEVAHLFPSQGEWSENDYLALHGNQMVELVGGRLELLPVPTWLHQLIVKYLVRAVEAGSNGVGVVLDAPLPVRLYERNIREPDVMYFAPGSEPRDPRGYPDRVDLAMEVVSEGTDARRRDYEDKRRDYARAGVLEYWIVDPEDQRITVLVLEGNEFRLHGEFTNGQAAAGVLLPDLKVNVAEVIRLCQHGDSR